MWFQTRDRSGSGVKQVGTLALLTSSLVLGGLVGMPFSAAHDSLQLAERQGAWDAELRLGRLAKDGTVTDLVLQLNVADKPETTYANVVYQVFALYDGDRHLVYSSRGARLLDADAGSARLIPELVAIANLQNVIDPDVDVKNVEIEASVEVRYDAPGEARDRRVAWTRTQPYQGITEITSSTQLSSQTWVD